MISGRLFEMPNSLFIRRWVKHFEINFRVNYLMITSRAPESTTKFSWEVNMKLIQEKDFPDCWLMN